MWVAVQTQAHKEKLAQLNLEKQGYETYCPRIMKRLRHARKVQDVLRPLFPGYLFINLNSEQSWRPILSTVGVSTLVRFGEKPGQVPNSLIDDLKAKEIDGYIPLPPVQDLFKVGEKIQIIGGPFDELLATVLSCEAKDRIFVLLDFMRRQIRLRLSTDDVLATA